MFTQEITERGFLSAAIPLLGLVLVVIALLLVLALFKWGRRILPAVVLGAPILIVVGAILIAASWSFHTLHISVDDSALEVGFYGPLGVKKRIPLQNITRCRATTYDWRDYGGIGAHASEKGQLFNVQGDGGIATELTLKNEAHEHLLFSSPDPQAVCDTLQEQRPAIN